MPARRILALALLLLAGCGRGKTFDELSVVVPVSATKPAASLHLTAPVQPSLRAADLALGQYRIFLAATVPAVGAAVHEQTGSPPISQAAAPTPSSGCGGDLPPCYVMMRESGGSYGAFNPSGCGGNGCYGKWQFSGAWAGKLGLPADLSQATPAQQDAAARQLWANGAGCQNWSACA